MSSTVMQILIWAVVIIIVAAFLRWQWSFILGFWQDGGRGQFPVLGMPAVIFLVLGVTALSLAAFNVDNLDAHYQNLVQGANDKAKQLREEILKEQELIDKTRSGRATSEENKERKTQLKGEMEKEKIFLQKLISLNNENPEYMFDLAMLAFREGDPQRGLSLMETISPFNEPGYAEGHLFLSQYFLQKKATSQKERQDNIGRAEKQIRNCLIADEANVDAKKIKAFIHDQKSQYLPAYEIYKELFEDDPKHYRDLLRLADILSKTSDKQSFLSQASIKFRQMTNKSSDNVAEWVDAWTHYVICMKRKGDLKSFSDAENAIRGELLNYGDDIAKKVFLKRQLSRVYSDRAISRGREAPTDVMKLQLSDLAKAIENDEKNDSALQWLTILGDRPEVADEARKIYDPRYDPNTPWVVLSELGHQALRKQDHENAITYFERARKKNPRNPQVLNNLAFAYLKAENRNPEQALLLVDQAITFLATAANFRDNRQAIVSSFFDTRGVALMQLGRMEEAAAAFEVAFRNRPKSKEIIKNLIITYTGKNERQAEAYRRRLEKLEREELSENREQK